MIYTSIKVSLGIHVMLRLSIKDRFVNTSQMNDVLIFIQLYILYTNYIRASGIRSSM